MRGLGIIREEHRLQVSVLNGMRYLIREIAAHKEPPNFDLLGAMIYYLDAFPERFHHRKEDEYLFARLLLRSSRAEALVNRLKQDHLIGAEKIRQLEQALARYQQGGAPEFTAFAAVAEDYVAFHIEHMRMEEQELLPLAVKYLTANDWEFVDNAFLGHTDPLLGASEGSRFRSLFQRIVDLAPPPVGIGPAATPESSHWTAKK